MHLLQQIAAINTYHITSYRIITYGIIIIIIIIIAVFYAIPARFCGC